MVRGIQTEEMTVVRYRPGSINLCEKDGALLEIVGIGGVKSFV
jgi:hypothetical protein